MPEKPHRLKLPSPQARSARALLEGRGALFAAGGVAATGILTLTGLPLNTETVVIAGKTYTFQTVLTDVDGNVLIGADASASIDNLIAAITLGAGSGTLYAASMTVHPTVTAAAGAGDTMDATAKSKGTAGDALTTTETLTNGSWGGATLASGADTDAEVILAPVVQWGSARIRVRITGASGTLGVEFVRPARQSGPGAAGSGAFPYAVDQPAIDGTVLVAGVEQSLEVTAAEHQGENWMKISLQVASEDAVLDFLDISGVNLGTYS